MSPAADVGDVGAGSGASAGVDDAASREAHQGIPGSD